MRKLILNILAVAVTAMTIFSCNDVRNGEVYRLLADVDSYIESRPDSALAVLEGIDKAELTTKELEAKYALLMSMALDKNYIDRTDFEVLQPAIDYYEDHGTATDKLRTFYYEGRIYQNQGNDENAMECFVKAADEGSKSDDYFTIARAYFAQGTVYYALYNHKGIIETSINALNYYELAGSVNNQMRCLHRIIVAYCHLGNREDADNYMHQCDLLLNDVNEALKSSHYSTKLSYCINFSLNNILPDVLDEYISVTDPSVIDWASVAYAYMILGEYEDAEAAMQKYSHEDESKYYSLWADIYKHKKDYKKALEAYEKYIAVSDSIDLVIFSQDTKFVEERHNLEIQAYKEREAKNNRTTIILICIIALLVALIAIYLIRKQLKIRTAEKRQLEIEKQRYEQLYADAIAERDALTKMVEDANVKEETKAVIRERLEILNKVIISHITDTSSANKKAYQELEALVANRESFIESTRLTIEGNNPEFIAALKKQGLTDEEINICCLYVIGLKGKDIKSYTSQPRHYNQSADIRHKLGLTENDTNLSIYLRELLEK